MYANNLDDAFSVFASGTTEEWVKSDKYMDYPEYHDEDYTYIEGRTIGDITAQVSVQGEAYSQYISFMINRYYDGIDLIGMSIWIHYELKDGSGSEDSPVNVMYNDSNIKFGWIIPEKATQQVGEIKIGVWVNGTAPNTKAYILKTEEKIYTIHPGLIPGSGITQPDSTWFENFANQMDSKVFIAQGHANDAQASKTAASDSATESAKSATASARALEENKAYVESQKEAFAGYNRRETDLKYANALIGSASGTTQVTVSDAWEAPIPGLEIAGKSEQITTKGLQMLDANTLANKMLNANTGVETVNSLWVATDYIPVVAGQQYKLTTNSNKYLNYALFFDENKIIKEGAGLSLVQNSGLFTVPEDVSYVRIRFYNGGNDLSISEIIDSNPMLNLGVTAQPYEPYTSGKPSPSPDNPQEIVSTDVTAVTVTGANMSKTAAITLTEPLRGIGDYRDRIMCRGGVWGVERNRKTVLYDGVIKGAFGLNSQWDTLYPGFMHCAITKIDDWLVGQKNFISNKFLCTTEQNRNFTNIELSCHTGNNGLYLFIGDEMVGIYDKDDKEARIEKVNNWIQSNNFMVEYSTATPAWEPLPAAAQSALNALTTYTGQTTITVTADGPEPDVQLWYVQDTNIIIAELKKLIEGTRNVKP